MSRYNAGRVGVLLSFILGGCSGGTSMSEVAGECGAAWGHDICTWTMTENGAVTQVGATIPVASLEAAPADAPFLWPPPADVSAAFPASAHGMTHLTVNWEAMGHPPATFLVPHFDFHFYLISQSDRMAIDCSNLSKAANVPAGYTMPDEGLPPELAQITGVDTLVGTCVPEMGMHAFTTADATNTQPFDGSMVIGYYGNRTIFFEPMISKAFLLRRQSFDLDVPTIPGLADAPTAFHAEYVPDQDAYRFSFSGFGSTS